MQSNKKLKILYDAWDHQKDHILIMIEKHIKEYRVVTEILQEIINLDAICENLAIAKYLNDPPRKIKDMVSVSSPLNPPYLCDMSLAYSLLKQGWQPLGYPLIYDGRILQTMVLYDTAKN